MTASMQHVAVGTPFALSVARALGRDFVSPRGSCDVMLAMYVRTYVHTRYVCTMLSPVGLMSDFEVGEPWSFP